MNITTQNMRAIFLNVLLGLATVAAVLVVIGGGWSFAKYTGILPLMKSKKALTIDNTPVTVENIKAIGELVTASYYDEMVVIVKKTPIKDEKKTVIGYKVERIPEDNAKNTKHLVTVQKAHARIGVDLANLNPYDFQVSKDGKTVDIILPDPECLDFIMNPSDIEIFSETDGWKFEDLKEAVAPAREEMEANMRKDEKLTEKAREGAREVMTQLLLAAGYENVNIKFVTNKTIDFKLPKQN